MGSVLVGAIVPGLPSTKVDEALIAIDGSTITLAVPQLLPAFREAGIVHPAHQPCCLSRCARVLLDYITTITHDR